MSVLLCFVLFFSVLYCTVACCCYSCFSVCVRARFTQFGSRSEVDLDVFFLCRALKEKPTASLLIHGQIEHIRISSHVFFFLSFHVWAEVHTFHTPRFLNGRSPTPVRARVSCPLHIFHAWPENPSLLFFPLAPLVRCPGGAIGERRRPWTNGWRGSRRTPTRPGSARVTWKGLPRKRRSTARSSKKNSTNSRGAAGVTRRRPWRYV